MANFVIDVRNYRSTHTALWLALTNVSAAGYRYCDRDSVAEHTITVRDGPDGPSVRLYLRQSDLYLVGFEGAGGRVFAFGDQAPNHFDQRLDMSVNYAQVAEAAKNEIINRPAVVSAISTLAGHAGAGWNSLSHPFLIMALMVSEALRFKTVFDKMCQVIGSSGAAVTRFNTWQPVVTSWSTDTTALHGQAKLMLKPSQLDVRTWHRFDR